jgi:hypothetical protein
MRIFKRTATPSPTRRTAADPAVLAEATAYTGAGPMAPLGTAGATIAASGRIMACTR